MDHKANRLRMVSLTRSGKTLNIHEAIALINEYIFQKKAKEVNAKPELPREAEKFKIAYTIAWKYFRNQPI